MDYAIYIPTYHRTDKQVTIDYIPDELKEKTFFVAPPEDEAPLAHYGVQVLTGAPPHIHNVRQWVLDNHDSDSHGPGILFLDDDLIFARRREDVPSRFHRVDGPGEMGELFNLISFALEHSPRGGYRVTTVCQQLCDTPKTPHSKLDLVDLMIYLAYTVALDRWEKHQAWKTTNANRRFNGYEEK